MLRTVLDTMTLTITAPLEWSEEELSAALEVLDRADWKNRVRWGVITTLPDGLFVNLLPDPGLE